MRLRIILSSLLLCFTLHVSASSSIRFVKGSFEQALAQAGKEKKLVLLYFTGTGCALCVKMEKNVFVQPEVYKAFNTSFVNFESFDDNGKPDSAVKELRRRYNIVSNPSFVVVDANGEVVHKAIGYRNTEQFAQFAKEALGNDNYSTWKQQFNTGNYSASLVYKLLFAEARPQFFVETGYECFAQEVLDKYFGRIDKKEYLLPENWQIIRKYVSNPFSEVFTFLVNNEALFADKFGKEEVRSKIYDAYAEAWSGFTESDRYKRVETMLRSSSNPVAKILVRMDDVKSSARAIDATDTTGWDKWIEENGSFVSENSYLLSPFKFYLWAYDICDNKNPGTRAVETANRWMKEVIAKAEEEDYDHYAVYAKTFFLLGNKAEAQLYQQKAVDAAVKSKADKEEVKELRKALVAYR